MSRSAKQVLVLGKAKGSGSRGFHSQFSALPGLTVLFATLLSVGSAGAQSRSTPAQKAAASEAFLLCRDMEKMGDAVPCWKLWVARHSSHGSEAEVMLASERVEKAEAAAPKTSSSATSAAAVGAEASPSSEKAEANPAPEGDAAEPQEELPENAEASTAVSTAPVSASGMVTDFCKADSGSSGASSKARVVQLGIGGVESLGADKVLQDINAGQVFAEVFAGRFPLERFQNVVTGIPAATGWGDQSTLPIATVRDHLTQQAKGKTELQGEAEFTNYSLGCTDYLVVPSVTSVQAKWGEGTVKGPSGEKKVKKLDLAVGTALSIFKREGDSFRLVKALSAKVPSLSDRMSDMAAQQMAGVAASASAQVKVPDVPGANIDIKGKLGAIGKAVPQIPEHISAIPTPGCLKPSAGGGGGSLAKCANSGGAASGLALATLDERMGPACLKAADPAATDQDRAVCEIRVRAGQAARGLQKSARSVEGWQLSAPLLPGDVPSFALGRAEGVKVGWGFEVKDAAGKRLAYYKVTRRGAGGPGGAAEPSTLNLRMGQSSAGATVYEVPQIGLGIRPTAEVAALVGNSGKTYVATTYAGAPIFLTYQLPQVVFGGGIAVDYDLSSLLSVPELRVVAQAGVLYGVQKRLTAMMIPIDLRVEKGFYLGKRLSMVIGVGGSVTQATLDAKASSWGGVPGKFTAMVFGPTARWGFDLALSPSVSLGFGGFGRFNVTKSEYKVTDLALIDFARRKDTWSAVGASLSLGFVL